jgi:hypothetical protein
LKERSVYQARTGKGRKPGNWRVVVIDKPCPNCKAPECCNSKAKTIAYMEATASRAEQEQSAKLIVKALIAYQTPTNRALPGL